MLSLRRCLVIISTDTAMENNILALPDICVTISVNVINTMAYNCIL